MHLPGKKNTAPEISEPMEGRVLEGEPHPQMLYNLANTTGTEQAQQGPSRGTHGLVHPHPDPAHVYREGANQPSGANQIHDPKRGVEAGQQPVNHNATTAAAPGSTSQGNPGAQVVEEKLPFKEQVRAYHKIQHGTLVGDHELKRTGQKILAGEIPPQ